MEKNGIRRAAIACALIYLLAFPASAQTAAAEGSISVESNVSNTEVYLDGESVGTAPVTITGLAPGTYQIILYCDGYYGESFAATVVSGKETKIKAELMPVTGTLWVKGIPDRVPFEIVVEGKSYSSPRIDLAEGSYTVAVRAFGFADAKDTVSIKRRSDTELTVAPEKVPFNATSPRPARAAFNPENPGNLGILSIGFSVTAPGTGTISIESQAGTTVRTISAISFTTWNQSLAWDGRDDRGALVGDGEYTIVLEASGSDGRDAKTARSAVRVDRAVVYPFTGCDATVGSTGPVVSGSLMPKGGVLVSLDAGAYPGSISPGISLLAGLSRSVEAGVAAQAFVDSGSNSTMNASAAVKAGARLGSLRPAIALSYRAHLAGSPPSPTPVRNGLALAPALEYETSRLAPFRIATGLYATVGYGDDEGLFIDPYGAASAGIASRCAFASLTVGSWLQANTSPFGSGFRAFDSWSAGASVKFLIPATNLVISAEAGYARGESLAGNGFFRAGFGVLY